MKIIDLSGEIYSGMPVFPGDPEVEIKQECSIENDEWNMKRITMNSHDSTHVNVPIHSKLWGKTLDDYSLSDFIAKARTFENEEDIRNDQALIFSRIDITQEIAEKIVEIRPPFIWVPEHFEFNLDIEKYLLENDIISFERLVNTDKLPKEFLFNGVPLKIKDWDGSPVRAYAII